MAPWILALVAVAVLALLPRPARGAATPTDLRSVTVNGKAEPRGIRNNNPGNLRDVGINWQGIGAPRADDAGYLRFRPHPDHGRAFFGIRAMTRDLLDDFARDGKVTVRELITEYAPHTENPTDAYIAAVSGALEVSPDARLDLLGNRRQLDALVRAIIRHENGRQPYTDAEIAAGINAAVTSFKP